MATKTVTLLNAHVVPPRAYTLYKRKNADTGRSEVIEAAPYSRRQGREAKLITSSGRDGRFRPCYHAQSSYFVLPLDKLPPMTSWYNTAVPDSTIIEQAWYGLQKEVHARRYTQFTTACDALEVQVASLPWAALGSSALQAMLPSFHTQNSLVNFLLELKDFKQVVRYGMGKLDKKISVMQALLGFGRSDKTLKKLSKQYLSYSFGWKPFFNDMVSLISEVVGFTTRYDQLVRRAGSPQQSYWGVDVAGSATEQSEAYSNGEGDGPYGGWTGPSRAKCRVRVTWDASRAIRYHATVRYRYVMPAELHSVVGKLKAFLDTLGVARNPAIIWNAIPFSFVIDWFTGLSSYLERLRVDNVHFKTEILDFCHSAKAERTVSMTVAGEDWFWLAASPLTPHGWTTTDQCRKVVYERRTGYPNYLEAIQLSGLNPREFSLTAALVGARKKRPKPHRLLR